RRRTGRPAGRAGGSADPAGGGGRACRGSPGTAPRGGRGGRGGGGAPPPPSLMVLLASPRVSRRPASSLATLLLLAIAQGLLLRRPALPGPTLTRRFTRLLPPRTTKVPSVSSEWPALPYEAWSATCDTLHTHTQ